MSAGVSHVPFSCLSGLAANITPFRAGIAVMAEGRVVYEHNKRKYYVVIKIFGNKSENEVEDILINA